MKKLLVILLAFALVFGLVLTGCPNGSTGGGKKPGGEEPTPPPPPGGADPIEVEFSADNTAIWGGVKMEPTADGKGVTVSYDPAASDNSHGNAAAMFKLDLKDNKVRDFEKVTFTFTGISGDLGPSTGKYDRGTEKGLNLLASANKDDMKNGGKDDGIVAVMVNKFVGGTAGGPTINESGTPIGKDQPTNTPKDLEIAIDPSRPKSSLGGEVWFCIYLHASAEKWTTATAADNPTEPTKFTITDLTFVPYEKPIGDVKVNELDITGVTAPVSGGTPVAAITNKNQYTGTVAWADAAGTAAGATFADATVYTATITLTVAEGFTFEGVEKNAFKVAGATATNDADTGVVTAKFPATEAPKFGLQKNGSYTLDPSTWKRWYGASATDNAVSFTDGGGMYLLFPTDDGFDITDYDKLEFKVTAVIDEKGNEGGAAVIPKLITNQFTAILGSGNDYGSALDYKNVTKYNQTTWTFTSSSTSPAYDFATPGWVGIMVQVNGSDTTDKFTVTFESIIFYPAE